MITFTPVEAQNRFGEVIDRSQHEPVEVTRRGRTVAYVITGRDMQELAKPAHALRRVSDVVANGVLAPDARYAPEMFGALPHGVRSAAP